MTAAGSFDGRHRRLSGNEPGLGADFHEQYHERHQEQHNYYQEQGRREQQEQRTQPCPAPRLSASNDHGQPHIDAHHHHHNYLASNQTLHLPSQQRQSNKLKQRPQQAESDHAIDSSKHNIYSNHQAIISLNSPNKNRNSVTEGENFHLRDDREDDTSSDEDEDSSSEALLAVASAEEYAAKIIKLQQACLIPLKEDLADWLNKILKTSNITTENFMDKLDNGVIICRLAKIISIWCEQQLMGLDETAIHQKRNDKMVDLERFEQTSKARVNPFMCANGPLRSSTSQSINCLVSSSSATSLNNSTPPHHRSCNQFMNNLIKMYQIKVWEDARCRTFYARDNVCNFIGWCRDFGVNQSVLFESDDLVLHANPRQVVLCLLDVARIAYVNYGFTEAPGLVKFEQEIDRELAFETNFAIERNKHETDSLIKRNHGQDSDTQSNITSPYKKLSSQTKNSMGVPFDRTDELVMRYCRHKEEEAARKRNQDLELAAISLEESSEEASGSPSSIIEDSLQTISPIQSKAILGAEVGTETSRYLEYSDRIDPMGADLSEITVAGGDNEGESDNIVIVSSTTCDEKAVPNNNVGIVDSSRVDSLDSGEGPTESASTGHSGQVPGGVSLVKALHSATTGIPVSKRRANFTPSLISHRASSMTHSELSSSRSSLLSNQDVNNSTSKYGRPITSDLDGKVMRIAKSYYGKKVSKDVTRLSEGKYRIADRIVFVRLLKGHRVMVRIGGGWDTLENFLFRHKSDPSQVIDPDNLLPLETKMPFDKSPQVTPAKSSRLPYYRRSNSASSTNLSLSNLSVSNHSLMSNSTPIHKNSERAVLKSLHSSPIEKNGRHISYLLIHKDRVANSRMNRIVPSVDSDTKQQRHNQLNKTAQQIHSPAVNLKQAFHHQQQKPTTPYLSRYSRLQRPLASSLASTLSATNLYPATLTTTKTSPNNN